MDTSLTWPTKIANAIVHYSGWGRFKPSSSIGHTITAHAFHAWSRGGLGMCVFEPQSKDRKAYIYACAFSAPKFEWFGIDWKTGWCTERYVTESRFQEDAGNSRPLNSYSLGVMPAENIEADFLALSPIDKKRILSLTAHLERTLGAFTWLPWKEHWDNEHNTQSSSRVSSLVEPIQCSDKRWVVANSDPRLNAHAWPTGLTASQLCAYLTSFKIDDHRMNLYIDIFEFQEKLEIYMACNQVCVWQSEHTDSLILGWAVKSGRNVKHKFFDVSHDSKAWPRSCTRIIAPYFERLLSNTVASLEYTEHAGDAAWLRASHSAITSSLFSMYSTVFGGRENLHAGHILMHKNIAFSLNASRGQKGTLCSMDTTNSNKSTVLDVLRQVRAYCGGILSVSSELVEENPVFWKECFENREVAALLLTDGTPGCAHWYHRYTRNAARPILDYPRTLNSEYSLYQTDELQWRQVNKNTVESPWGWRSVLDQYDWNGTIPKITEIGWDGYEQSNEFEDRLIWRFILDRWLKTWTAKDAARVMTALTHSSTWPIKTSDYVVLATHFFKKNEAIWALCEMSSFDANVVLQALANFENPVILLEPMFDFEAI